MSFLGDYRDRRREMKLKLKAAKAKAKEDAKHEAKLKDKAYRDGRKAAEAERKRNAKDAKKEAKRNAKLDTRAAKRAEKIRKAGWKDEQKALKAKHKHQENVAAKILEQQRNQGLTRDKAKGWVGASAGAGRAAPRLPPDDVRAEPRPGRRRTQVRRDR